jgi:hypothetical protein
MNFLLIECPFFVGSFSPFQIFRIFPIDFILQGIQSYDMLVIHLTDNVSLFRFRKLICHGKAYCNERYQVFLSVLPVICTIYLELSIALSPALSGAVSAYLRAKSSS